MTPKETDVLRLIASGNANKEIAAQLSITDETAREQWIGLTGWGSTLR